MRFRGASSRVLPCCSMVLGCDAPELEPPASFRDGLCCRGPDGREWRVNASFALSLCIISQVEEQGTSPEEKDRLQARL